MGLFDFLGDTANKVSSIWDDAMGPAIKPPEMPRIQNRLSSPALAPEVEDSGPRGGGPLLHLSLNDMDDEAWMTKVNALSFGIDDVESIADGGYQQNHLGSDGETWFNLADDEQLAAYARDQGLGGVLPAVGHPEFLAKIGEYMKDEQQLNSVLGMLKGSDEEAGISPNLRYELIQLAARMDDVDEGRAPSPDMLLVSNGLLTSGPNLVSEQELQKFMGIFPGFNPLNVVFAKGDTPEKRYHDSTKSLASLREAREARGMSDE
jgi:hypothetical protein